MEDVCLRAVLDGIHYQKALPKMQAEEAESHYTDANSAFKTICAVEEPWIELFHSRPSWKVCQISYSKDDGKSWVPFSMYKVSHHPQLL